MAYTRRHYRLTKVRASTCSLSQSSVYCDFCESNGVNMWKCLDCDCRPVMCDKCKDNIHPKVSKNHRIERIKEEAQKDTSGCLKFHNIKCEEHEGMFCSHYCKACSKVICPQCITKTKTHNRHHILVDEKDFEDKMQRFEKAQRNKPEWSIDLNRIKNTKKEIDEQFDNIKQDILNHKKELQSMVDRYADMLNKELKKHQTLIMIDIDIEHNEIEEIFNKIQTAGEILGSKPCTTTEGVIFFLENFDSLSDSLTEKTPVGGKLVAKRLISFPEFVPGKFSFLKFGSLKVGEITSLDLDDMVGYRIQNIF